MENQIMEFSYIEALEDYDKINNPLKLPAYELLPVGIKWKYNGQEYIINNGTKITALLLTDNQNIVVIEEPDDEKLNKAYIVNGKNEIKYDIKKIIRQDKEIINDVKYVNNELYYFGKNNGIKYKFTIDLEKGGINKLIFIQ
jgi:hypothetical protein